MTPSRERVETTGEGRSVTLPTLVELLQHQADRYRDKLAFDYANYSSGGEQHNQLTYHQLDINARAIASVLQRHGAAGERVLVLCPSGLDFIAAFFGCLYAGAVAIPVHPPVRARVTSRVASIVADARAGFVVTTTELRTQLEESVNGLAEGRPLVWCAADAVTPDAAADWTPPAPDADAPAFVQYTSGSTSSPKGVVLTHRNLLTNLEAIRRASGGSDSTVIVSWLPLHHDMGLIGATLGALYMGGTTYLMPPEAFIQRPMRWLELVSLVRAELSVAPDFAYNLCVETSSAAERSALDLSHWAMALSGAEPVRPTTLRRFAEAFAPAGFRPQALRPVYGLAEATLLVSAGQVGTDPVVRQVDSIALREHLVTDVPPEHPHAATLVGCGMAQYGVDVVIADPQTRRSCRADEVGEIWVGGDGVAQGYLGKPAETRETFSAFLSDTGCGPFLRTGDLGCLLDGELFITGRLKDLIIIRGANYYPNDIEATAQESHPSLLRGRGAAFSVMTPSRTTEGLVLVQEVARDRIGESDVGDVMAGIRTAVTEQHDIAVHDVLLVDPLRIPTTSSGKIRRNECRRKFLAGDLEPLAEWHAPSPGEVGAAAAPGDEAARPAERDATEIAAWFVSQLAQELAIPADEIDTAQPFAYYGVDSVRAVRLTTALETWLGCTLSPTVAYEYPTIDLLSRHLAGKSPIDVPAKPEFPSWRGPFRSAARPHTVFFQVDVDTTQLPVLSRPVHGSAVLPAATVLQLVFFAAARAFGAAPRRVRDVAFRQTLVLPDGRPRTLQIAFHGNPPDPVSFECYGGEPAPAGPLEWSLVASGALDAAEAPDTDAQPHNADVIKTRCAQEISGPTFYRALAGQGFEHQAGVQAVQVIWRRDGEAIARLHCDAGAARETHDLDDALLDACVQVLTSALARDGHSEGPYLPVGLSELRIHRRPAAGDTWCHALLRKGLQC